MKNKIGASALDTFGTVWELSHLLLQQNGQNLSVHDLLGLIFYFSYTFLINLYERATEYCFILSISWLYATYIPMVDTETPLARFT